MFGVGASPNDANQGEKDLQDPGSGNNARVTPAPVQLVVVGRMP